MNIKTSFFLISIVCLFIFLFSFISEIISIVLAIIFGFILFWRAKLDILIGLFLLYIIKHNFYQIVDFRSMGNVIEKDFVRENVELFGFPLNLPTLACFFVPIRVILENVYNKNTFAKNNLLYRLWLCALIPGFISFILSFITRDPNWTRGFRFLLLSSSFFYGLILSKNLNYSTFKLFVKYLLGLIIISLVLLNFKFFWSHLVFLFLGLASSLSIFLIFNKNALFKLFGFILIILTLAIIFNSTITILLIGFLSFLLILLSWTDSFYNSLSRRKKILISMKKIFLVFLILFPFILVYVGNILGIDIGFLDLNTNAGIEGRIMEKLLLDRYPLWQSSFNQIINGPYFFVPSGRPLIVNGLDSDFEWIVGAHNVVLEVYRNTGIFVGSIILFIYLYTINRLFDVLIYSYNNLLKTIASALIGVSISGILTGDFPADMTVGFFLWCISGLVIGLNKKDNFLYV